MNKIEIKNNCHSLLHSNDPKMSYLKRLTDVSDDIVFEMRDKDILKILMNHEIQTFVRLYCSN